MTEPNSPNSVPGDLRDLHILGVQGRNERSGWVYRGTVKVDSTWKAYIEAGPKSIKLPALMKKPTASIKGQKSKEDQGPREALALPMFMTLRWDPRADPRGDLTVPSEVIVRIVVPDFKFRINWRPWGSISRIKTMADDPGHYVPVTKIIPFDPEWAPYKDF